MFNRIAGCHSPAELTHKINLHGSQSEGHGAHLHFSQEERYHRAGHGDCAGQMGPWELSKHSAEGATSVIPEVFSPGVCPFSPTGIGYRYPLALLNSSTSIQHHKRLPGAPSVPGMEVHQCSRRQDNPLSEPWESFVSFLEEIIGTIRFHFKGGRRRICSSERHRAWALVTGQGAGGNTHVSPRLLLRGP